MTDTIILHPNDDGTYHWMCPNCKREDLGLSAETDLTAYCPNVTCPDCGFQFGVDKRYLTKPQEQPREDFERAYFANKASVRRRPK